MRELDKLEGKTISEIWTNDNTCSDEIIIKFTDGTTLVIESSSWEESKLVILID